MRVCVCLLRFKRVCFQHFFNSFILFVLLTSVYEPAAIFFGSCQKLSTLKMAAIVVVAVVDVCLSRKFCPFKFSDDCLKVNVAPNCLLNVCLLVFIYLRSPLQNIASEQLRTRFSFTKMADFVITRVCVRGCFEKSRRLLRWSRMVCKCVCYWCDELRVCLLCFVYVFCWWYYHLGSDFVDKMWFKLCGSVYFSFA